jgi:uncharacterized protein YukE
MNAFSGMNVEQVRHLSSQLTHQADQIHQILTSLTGTLDSTQWTGPDSERFRDEWATSHTSGLLQIVSAMQDAAQRAEHNAAEQENTSR